MKLTDAYQKSPDFPAPEDDPESPEAVAAAKIQAQEQLQSFGASLAAMRDRWVKARRATGVEKRWQEDIDRYNGVDSANRRASEMMTSVEQGFPVTTRDAKPHRSTVYIGLTRQKVNTAEARLSDILLPTDDKNWGIEPTPDPEVAGQIEDQTQLPPDPNTGQVPMVPIVDPTTNEPVVDPATGQPVQRPARKSDVAKAIDQLAREKAEAMEREIEDQLAECDFNGEVRKMLHDAALLGTGVLKGPVVMSKVKKVWRNIQGEQVLEVQEDLSPATFRVDPRKVFPDPACGDDVQNGRGVFEYDEVTAKKLREMAKQPFYLPDQIRKVLEEGPTRVSALTDKTEQDEGRDTEKDRLFEVWHYWGELDLEDLRAAQVPGLPEEGDPLASVSGCVVMVNNTVIKAFLNPLETGELPYDFYQWEQVAGTVWGLGMSHLMKSQQSVMNAAWRQLMDNAGSSSGPQIVMAPGKVAPANKQWTLQGPKIWWAKEDVDDVRKVFDLIQIDSRQAELTAIIALAQQMADAETGTPLLAQGEKGPGTAETLGGMQMQMNAANVVLRRQVKNFDDRVTKRHLRRYYDFNMAYSDKMEIKGDMNVVAKATGALIIRDVQNQAFMNMLQTATNPAFAPLIDMKKLFSKTLQSQHINPEDVLKSDEQVAAEQQAAAQNPPPKDPRVEAAQIKSQTDIQVAQARAEAERARAEGDLQLAAQEREFRIAQLQTEVELAILQLANDKDISMEQVRAKLSETAIKLRSQKEMQAAEMALKLSPQNQSGLGI